MIELTGFVIIGVVTIISNYHTNWYLASLQLSTVTFCIEIRKGLSLVKSYFWSILPYKTWEVAMLSHLSSSNLKFGYCQKSWKSCSVHSLCSIWTLVRYLNNITVKIVNCMLVNQWWCLCGVFGCLWVHLGIPIAYSENWLSPVKSWELWNKISDFFIA